MKTIPNIGDVIWTISPTSESIDCGDRESQWPTEAKVANLSLGGTTLVVASCFNKETGVTDDDANATFYLGLEECYETRKEALEAYLAGLEPARENAQRKLVEIEAEEQAVRAAIAEEIAIERDDA